MKVWEKVTSEFNDVKNMDRAAIKEKMFRYRMEPCEANLRHSLLTEEQMEQVCNGYECETCLDRYLDMEVSR